MEKLQIRVEALEQRRSKWLMITLIGFCIWDGLRIVESYLLGNYTSPILIGIMLLGWLIWVIGLIQILRIGKEMKRNIQLCQILNDELIELTRFKAWRASLVMVGLTQAIIILTTLFVTEISGILAAEISIFVLVTSAIGGFFYFDREYNE